LVRQTPPAGRRDIYATLSSVQVGAIASAVIRPEVMYCCPLKVRISGKTEVLGPIRCHGPTGASGAAAAATAGLLACIFFERGYGVPGRFSWHVGRRISAQIKLFQSCRVRPPVATNSRSANFIAEKFVGVLSELVDCLERDDPNQLTVPGRTF